MITITKNLLTLKVSIDIIESKLKATKSEETTMSLITNEYGTIVIPVDYSDEIEFPNDVIIWTRQELETQIRKKNKYGRDDLNKIARAIDHPTYSYKSDSLATARACILNHQKNKGVYVTVQLHHVKPGDVIHDLPDSNFCTDNKPLKVIHNAIVVDYKHIQQTPMNTLDEQGKVTGTTYKPALQRTGSKFYLVVEDLTSSLPDATAEELSYANKDKFKWSESKYAYKTYASTTLIGVFYDERDIVSSEFSCRTVVGVLKPHTYDISDFHAITKTITTKGIVDGKEEDVTLDKTITLRKGDRYQHLNNQRIVEIDSIVSLNNTDYSVHYTYINPDGTSSITNRSDYEVEDFVDIFQPLPDDFDYSELIEVTETVKIGDMWVNFITSAKGRKVKYTNCPENKMATTIIGLATDRYWDKVEWAISGSDTKGYTLSDYNYPKTPSIRFEQLLCDHVVAKDPVTKITTTMNGMQMLLRYIDSLDKVTKVVLDTLSMKHKELLAYLQQFEHLPEKELEDDV